MEMEQSRDLHRGRRNSGVTARKIEEGDGPLRVWPGGNATEGVSATQERESAPFYMIAAGILPGFGAEGESART